MIFANATLRADAGVIMRNRRGQSGLWGYAISGDLPIVLLQIADLANIALVRQLLQARAYWRLKGLVVDLVIWTEDQSGYRQQLHDAIMGLIAAGVEANALDRPGGIFVRHSDHISLEDRLLLQSVARIIIVDSRGSLSEQLKRRRAPEVGIPDLQAVTTRPRVSRAPTITPRADLILTNDIGGFTRDGREYVVTLTPGRTTPAPWVNVIANAQFGTVVSENGGGYTWSENAHEFRVTPWHDDPVTDESGEAFYLRDEETGRFWSPTPLPAPGGGPYVSRHGFGYSVFEHDTAGIYSEMTVHVATDAPVKFSVLKIRNDSGQARRLSVTGYVEWVLGDLRPKNAMHVTTEIDAADRSALRAQLLQPASSPIALPSSTSTRPAARSPAIEGSSWAAIGRCSDLRRWHVHACRASVGAGTRSLRGDPGRLRPRARPGATVRLSPGRRREHRRRTYARGPLPRRRGRAAGARVGVGLLEAHARRRAGGDA